MRNRAVWRVCALAGAVVTLANSACLGAPGDDGDIGGTLEPLTRTATTALPIRPMIPMGDYPRDNETAVAMVPWKTGYPSCANGAIAVGFNDADVTDFMSGGVTHATGLMVTQNPNAGTPTWFRYDTESIAALAAAVGIQQTVGDPSMGVTTTGRIYYSSLASTQGTFSSSTLDSVLLLYSDDCGASWTAKKFFSPVLSIDHPLMHIDPSGAPWIAFTDQLYPRRGHAVRFDPATKVFGAILNLPAGGPMGDTWPVLASIGTPGAGGTLFAVWGGYNAVGSPGLPDDVTWYLSASSNAGVSWGPANPIFRGAPINSWVGGVGLRLRVS